MERVGLQGTCGLTIPSPCGRMTGWCDSSVNAHFWAPVEQGLLARVYGAGNHLTSHFGQPPKLLHASVASISRVGSGHRSRHNLSTARPPSNESRCRATAAGDLPRSGRWPGRAARGAPETPIVARWIYVVGELEISPGAADPSAAPDEPPCVSAAACGGPPLHQVSSAVYRSNGLLQRIEQLVILVSVNRRVQRVPRRG
jgi:hypothetical protein